MRTRDGYDALYRAHHARILRLCRLLVADAQEASDVTTRSADDLPGGVDAVA